MGTKNNVNPGHYKTAGRERPGQDVNQEIQKQEYTQSQQKDTTNPNGSDYIPSSVPKLPIAPDEKEND